MPALGRFQLDLIVGALSFPGSASLRVCPRSADVVANCFLSPQVDASLGSFASLSFVLSTPSTHSVLSPCGVSYGLGHLLVELGRVWRSAPRPLPHGSERVDQMP